MSTLVDDAELAIALARKAADIILALVPADTARQLLDEAAVKRANDAADLAERIKFGPP